MIPQIDEILNLYKEGKAEMEQAVQWVGSHIQSAATDTMLRDHFALSAKVPVDEAGFIPKDIAQNLMGEAAPQLSNADFGSAAAVLKVNQWWHIAEARLRYLKADAMMAARIL